MWQKLAKSVKDVPSLTVGEIDATANDVEDLVIKQYPTIVLFSRENKQGEEYDGERDAEALMSWLSLKGVITNSDW